MTTYRATLAFACGSKSIKRTFFSRSTKAPARLITVVVFPTPPLLFATLIIRGRVGAGFVIPFPFCLSLYRDRYVLDDMARQEKLQRFCTGRFEGVAALLIVCDHGVEGTGRDSRCVSQLKSGLSPLNRHETASTSIGNVGRPRMRHV